ncbi:MAG TPA: hypothetical protein PKH24_00285 [Sedimentisphaerales bacterium]|jgi:hypothetical protein|nr:hypothetical protein [Sedimentisphaerales bacterium]HNU27670.1 hypothetical protein [Sedimentisphaerales bacterium]
MRLFLLCTLLLAGAATVRGGEHAGPVPGQPVTAVFPERWTPPPERRGAIDFALSVQADAWLRHGVLGDPSFDSFERRPGNPIVRGKPPFNWPVNGFLFEDPKSGNWYAYVGHYLTGYDIGPELPKTHCRVHRSKDRGATWEDLGPIFDDPQFRFQGDSHPSNTAPDITLVLDGDRYHIAYDWASDNWAWSDALNPRPDAESGCAYAWSERPEGPFHRAERPILRARELPLRFAMARKYHRAYATSIIRRQKDWLALLLSDSSDYFSWGVLAMTASDPAGEWTDPVMVMGVEGDGYFPPTVEAFPAMVHDGYVYSQSTSVSRNRNFQAIYRAKIEEAHRPEAWRLYQHGSTWHSEFVVNEEMGLWGQTYSGFVDRDGQFQVLFPSRERQANVGTINLAVRPWSQPLRERTFVLSGHAGRSLTVLRYAWKHFSLKAELTLHGGAARILWAYQAPLSANRHQSDSTIHPLSMTRHQGLEISVSAWRIVSVDASGEISVQAEGPLETGVARSIEMSASQDGRFCLKIDQKARWEGALPVAAGQLGLLVEPFTNLRVSRFEIEGPFEPAVMPWLYVEALTGAGVTMRDWNMIESPIFRFAVGALRKTPGDRAKWNFRGRGFQLWSPRGPMFGRCELLLDGRKLADLDFYAESEQPSRVVYRVDDAGDGYHAVILRSTEGRLVVDSLDVLN